MPGALHILSLQRKLKTEKDFLKSLICRNITKRRSSLKQAKTQQLRVLQKLLSAYCRGDIAITSRLLHRLKRSKKLNFLRRNFQKILPHSQLRQQLLSLASVLHYFVKPLLTK